MPNQQLAGNKIFQINCRANIQSRRPPVILRIEKSAWNNGDPDSETFLGGRSDGCETGLERKTLRWSRLWCVVWVNIRIALRKYNEDATLSKKRNRIIERAAMTTAWREKKLKNVIVGITGAGGNAATRLEAYVSKNGVYTSGVIPEVEDLFQRQARETDAKKREALIHQIQGILRDRMIQIPIYELAFIWRVSPRVEEPGINLIRSFAYSGPLEDVKIKRP